MQSAAKAWAAASVATPPAASRTHRPPARGHRIAPPGAAPCGLGSRSAMGSRRRLAGPPASVAAGSDCFPKHGQPTGDRSGLHGGHRAMRHGRRAGAGGRPAHRAMAGARWVSGLSGHRRRRRGPAPPAVTSLRRGRRRIHGRLQGPATPPGVRDAPAVGEIGQRTADPESLGARTSPRRGVRHIRERHGVAHGPSGRGGRRCRGRWTSPARPLHAGDEAAATRVRKRPCGRTEGRTPDRRSRSGDRGGAPAPPPHGRHHGMPSAAERRRCPARPPSVRRSEVCPPRGTRARRLCPRQAAGAIRAGTGARRDPIGDRPSVADGSPGGAGGLRSGPRGQCTPWMRARPRPARLLS